MYDVNCDFLKDLCLKHFSFSKEIIEISYKNICVHVEYPIFLSDSNEN
jgi:hypothetical protein